MHIRRCRKLSRCDIRRLKNLDFGLCMLYLCIREVRLRLSIAFEIQLSSLCVRFALTLPTAKSGCTSAKFSKTSFQVLHSVCTDIAFGNKGSTAALKNCILVLTDEKQYSLFIHSAFFDIMLPQKVRQVGLSETPDTLLNCTTCFCDWTLSLPEV